MIGRSNNSICNLKLVKTITAGCPDPTWHDHANVRGAYQFLVQHDWYLRD